MPMSGFDAEFSVQPTANYMTFGEKGTVSAIQRTEDALITMITVLHGIKLVITVHNSE
jgi:hypothetical protein